MRVDRGNAEVLDAYKKRLGLDRGIADVTYITTVPRSETLPPPNALTNTNIIIFEH